MAVTFYKFNCGFIANIQHLISHLLCGYADRELARNPQLNL
jgi:hypothetical protein